MSTLTAFRTAPQKEHKAAQELREAGHKAYVPRQRTRRRSAFTGKFWPVAPRYVISDATVRSVWAKHVGGPIGPVPPHQLARLYENRPSKQQTADKFKAGDQVIIRRGKHEVEMLGVVEDRRKAGYMVRFELFGKWNSVFIPQRYLYHVTRPG